MKRQTIVIIASWSTAVVSALLAIVAWGQGFAWQFDAISAYLLFPLFGLVAFSLMWSHYIAGSVRRMLGISKIALQPFLNITGYAVLVLILLHPGVLIYQLWRDGFGLPPSSYTHFVAHGLGWVALLGTVSFGVFLAYELRPWFHDRSWWPWVIRAGDVAMIAIVYHGLRLGSQTQTGWYHWAWLFYGLTLIVSLGYNYYIDRQLTTKKE